MTRITSDLPEKLSAYLRSGAPVLILTTGEDGFPNVAYSWAVARDTEQVRFGADLGSATLASLEREPRAALSVIGSGNLVFLIKGSTRVIKDRIAAAPFRMALIELSVTEVKDQSWPAVTVNPLTYEWHPDQREKMLQVEQAVYAEMRDAETMGT